MPEKKDRTYLVVKQEPYDRNILHVIGFQTASTPAQARKTARESLPAEDQPGIYAAFSNVQFVEFYNQMVPAIGERPSPDATEGYGVISTPPLDSNGKAPLAGQTDLVEEVDAVSDPAATPSTPSEAPPVPTEAAPDPWEGRSTSEVAGGLQEHAEAHRAAADDIPAPPEL